MEISPIEEIKSRLDIVDVIGNYIKLQKVGVNYRALCPFHQEKTPSFFVSPSRQIFKCFGCGKSGDIFRFVMEIEGVEFGDALRILAQKAGVTLKKQDSKLKTERQRLYEICELSTQFFEKQLQESRSGKEVQKYLLERGISKKSIKKWRIGYSPDARKGLLDFLISQGYDKEEINKAGLVVRGRDINDFYDRFRGRIIFPIFDLNSQVVGFGGRVFKEKDKKEIAKYINTPNTLLYDKSRILYGIDKAKIEIRKRDFCILVEGYTDAIMCHQAGFENSVAVSGTALTPFQLKILKRYSDNLYIAFDMDIAGNTATKRGIDLAQSRGFNIKVVTLPKQEDPADVIFKDPAKWQDCVANSKSILDFYFEVAFASNDPSTVEGKKQISKMLLPEIKIIPNEIEKSYWIQELSKRLDIKETYIEEELKKLKIESSYEGSDDSDLDRINLLPQKSRKQLLEERLLILLLKFPSGLELIEDRSFFSNQAKEILESLEKKQNLDSDFFNYLFLKSEIEEIEENKDAIEEIKYCLKELQFLEIKDKLDRTSKEIKKAEEEKDFERVKRLTEEFNKLLNSNGD